MYAVRKMKVYEVGSTFEWFPMHGSRAELMRIKNIIYVVGEKCAIKSVRYQCEWTSKNIFRWGNLHPAGAPNDSILHQDTVKSMLSKPEGEKLSLREKDVKFVLIDGLKKGLFEI